MLSLLRKEEQEKVVIEGTYCDEWNRGYMLSRFAPKIPSDAKSINVDGEGFILVGIRDKTKGAWQIATIQEKSESKTKDVKIEGMFLLQMHTRVLIASDGRVFMNEHLAKSEESRHILDDVLRIANKQFGGDFERLYSGYLPREKIKSKS